MQQPVKVFFCFVLLVSLNGFSQVLEWNRQVLNEKLPLETRLDFNDSIMAYFRKFDIDSSMFYANRHLILALEGNEQYGANYAFSVIASLHRYRGELDLAIENYQKAIRGYKLIGYPNGVAAMYSNIATVYKQKSRYDLAIANYFKAITIMKSVKDKNTLLNMYSSLAGLYFKLENYEKAAFYWDLSTKTSVNTPLRGQYTFGYRGKARIYIEKKRFDLAEKEIRKALIIDKKLNNNLYLYEDYLIQLKLYAVSVDQRKFQEIQEKLKPFLAIENPLNKQHYYEFCGDFYLNIRNFSQAESYFKLCLNTIPEDEKSDDYLEDKLRITHKWLSASFFKENGGKYYDLFKQQEKLSKEVEGIKRVRQTQELDFQYQLNDTQEKNAQLKERNEFYRKLNAKNSQQRVLLLVILLVVAAFSVYLIVNSRRLNKVKAELEQLVEEKEFLFKEVNHRVKNNLLIVNSFIGIEKQGKSEQVQQALADMETRIYSLGLMHELLYKNEMSQTSSLGEYLKALLDFLSQTIVSSNVRVESEIQDQVLIHINKLSYIGLIVNELITNSIKYAGKETELLTISVRLVETPEQIQIGIADDGIGLPSNFELKNTNSMGLKMASGLTKQLKGELHIMRKEKGTTFMIEIPKT